MCLVFGYTRYGCVAFERADITLHDLLSTQSRELSSVQKLAIAHQLLSAVAHLHSLGIVHGDLKPQNVVKIYSKDVWKLIDFASARKAGDLSAIEYTLRYAAPEVCTYIPYNTVMKVM